MATERSEPGPTLGEREMLTGWLDYHRATLRLKCEGLDPDQLRERAVPPSALSLIGLVRHMAEVEVGWFRHGFAREKVEYHWVTDEEPNAEFDDVDTADVDEAFSAWDDEIARARAIEAAAGSLDETFTTDKGTEISLRWVVTHMIEEYARHNGHADLLRERLDGSTGD